jgi:hypothetical protein
MSWWIWKTIGTPGSSDTLGAGVRFVIGHTADVAPFFPVRKVADGPKPSPATGRRRRLEGDLVRGMRAAAAATVVAASLLAPAVAGAQQPGGASLDDAGRLTLDFKVDRFVVRDGRLAAHGIAVPTLRGTGSGLGRSGNG